MIPCKQLVKVFVALCDEAGTPLSEKLSRAARCGDWNTVVNTKVDPRSYDNPASFYKDWVVSNFLRKGRMTVEGIDTTAAAQEKFWDCERENHRTNLRLFRFSENFGLEPGDQRILDFLQGVKRRMGTILGPLPRDLSDGRFGPGATFDKRGKEATLLHKLASVPTTTSECSILLPLIEQSAWMRAVTEDRQLSLRPEVVRGNRFTAVRKTALTDRGICIEASLNVYAQLALGSHISRRLKQTVGLVKEKSQERHRFLAWKASVLNELFTMDLSDASELQCYQLVKACVPDDWFDVLCATRSAFTRVGDKWVKLEKFSSMGNGWTFELMTTLLLSIILTLAEELDVDVEVGKDVSVYGDDIIAPKALAAPLRVVLTFLGYKINERKTFVDEQFKESCGGDFFRGHDVTPYYVETLPTEPAQWMALANGIRRLGRQHAAGFTDFPSFRRAWFICLDAIPIAQRRLRGPEHLGDLVIHDDEERWQVRRTAGKRLSYRETPDKRKFVRGWVPFHYSVRANKFSPIVQLAAALYGVPSSGVVPRANGDDAIAGHRLKWLAVGW